MNTRQIAKSALRSITRNKLRSALMMVGVMVGVGGMTVVTALGKSTIQEVMDKIETEFSANSIFLSAGGGTMHGGARGDGPATTLTIDDLDAIVDRVANVDMHAPSVSVGSKMVTYNGTNREVRITGHSESAEFLYRGEARGSFIGRNDVLSSARVALIGQDTAAEFFAGMDPIGEQVRIAAVPFEIIGVIEEGGVDVHGINTDDVFFVPVTTAMRRLLNIDHIMTAKLHVADATQMEATVSSIEEVLRERHGLRADAPNDFRMITPVQVQEIVESGNRTLTLFLPLISAIAIIAGALIIASLMLVAVNERRAEIGLRKAVGARSKDIQVQFLVEAVTITVIAGLLGLALGSAGSQLLLNMQDKPLTLPWAAMGIGLATSVAVGLLAGVFPARRAAALQPVETLR